MRHATATEPPVATFSLVARDPDTGDLGVAVASKFLAVGAYVPTAVAGVGAVASQAHVNTTYGQRAIDMLAGGASPADCVRAFRESDDGSEVRQFGIVAADGASASHTGAECLAWAGGVAGDGFAAQGNILAGPRVVDALVAGVARRDLPFPERLVAALAAAEEAGGDARGRQSAALLVVGEGKGYAGLTDRWIDLRVDDHPTPVAELGRLLALHRLYLDKPSSPPRRLSEEDVRWLQGVLVAAGHLAGAPSGAWDEATERALETLYGIENLEERWIGGAALDPVAWQHLRERFGGETA
ncbi:MAG TPA: DUF1028 domain-containing protein [Trueperaceae bacterium]|nr:DUF1028 domain-containing protein [Trueperaceae bacterium]